MPGDAGGVRAGGRWLLAAVAAALLVPLPARAQQVQWEALPRMQLERQFAGPLKDTIIQRWRDPADGTVCYIYLPINAPHTPPPPGGYVQYGPNTIGAISCMASTAAQGAAPAAQPAARSAPATPAPSTSPSRPR